MVIAIEEALRNVDRATVSVAAADAHQPAR
jgi:hypothetical protein